MAELWRKQEIIFLKDYDSFLRAKKPFFTFFIFGKVNFKLFTCRWLKGTLVISASNEFILKKDFIKNEQIILFCSNLSAIIILKKWYLNRSFLPLFIAKLHQLKRPQLKYWEKVKLFSTRPETFVSVNYLIETCCIRSSIRTSSSYICNLGWTSQ
jgi:hypothetical protein